MNLGTIDFHFKVSAVRDCGPYDDVTMEDNLLKSRFITEENVFLLKRNFTHLGSKMTS